EKRKIKVKEIRIKEAAPSPKKDGVRKANEDRAPYDEEFSKKDIPAKQPRPISEGSRRIKPSPSPRGISAPSLGTNKPKGKTETKPPVKRRAPKAPMTPLIEDFTPEAWEPEVPASEEGKSRFIDLGILSPLLRAINVIGFQYATDIQSQILPHSLKGVDVTGRAQTGTGKTAAFLLTIYQHLMKNRPMKPRLEGAPRALIMAPTRELVLQIKKDADELGQFCNSRTLAIFGGIDYDVQQNALDDYVDIIIATPGRLLDYYKQRSLRLDRVEILVLDEADRMLDMGFLPDIRRIIDATPPKSERQTMLFSATLPKEILRLASMWMNTPIQVEIEPEQITSADVEQLAYIISGDDKLNLLINLLIEMNLTRGIIFANRKDQVNRLAEQLAACNFLCGMLTGDVNQSKRIKTLENLRNGKINILVATDVAGRGIHVEGIEAVFNFTLPLDPEDYVHRIGRTGRAGAKGKSICFATEDDAYMLPSIETYINQPLKYIVPDDSLIAPLPEKFQIMLKNLKRKRKPPEKRKIRKKF
ncbi:MAG: DEAD/DEAH box helicase, partial [Deferribacteraceae bacterium]|nr:DEAD/DEAH box helicase [Deferribacteraceae bacterium]